MNKLSTITVLLLASALLLWADATGTWAAEVTLAAGNGTATFVIQQNGEILSGTYAGTFGQAAIKGKATGNQVEWSFNGGEVGVVTFKGVLDGATIKGTAVYGQLGDGTFTATKK